MKARAVLPRTVAPRFRCRPEVLCEKAACCRDAYSRPALTLVDYADLSRLTGRRMSDLWRKEGDIDLAPLPSIDPYYFGITLSLLHDPCRFLAADFTCGVYRQRPLECALFPLGITADACDRERAESKYPCTIGFQLTERLLRLIQEVRRITHNGGLIGNELLWDNQRAGVELRNFGDVQQVLDRGLSFLQDARTQAGEDRKQRIFDAKREFELQIQAFLQGGPVITSVEISLLLSPLFYYLLADQIAERLDHIEDHSMRRLDGILRERKVFRRELAKAL